MKIKIDLVLSNGYTLGPVKTELQSEDKSFYKGVKRELKILDNAIKKSLKDIDETQAKEPKLKDYFLAQRFMISDPMLYSKAKELIEQGLPAKKAFKEAMNDFITNLNKSTSAYLKERIADLEDVVQIINSNIDYDIKNKENESYILICDKVRPSTLIHDHKNILGIISRVGGFTSHSAILSRSWSIPYVVLEELPKLNDGDIIIIDTRKNIVIVSPESDLMEKCKKEIEEKSSYENVAIEHNDFLFLANVSTNKDIDRVLNSNFDAIGLYRTELIFMNSKKPYTEEEQYTIYSEATELMKDKFITFRTFDVGDDKQIEYLVTNHKGFDNYIKNPKIFEDQVKALLRANKYNNMRIMFPMIETEEEFIYLKNWVLRLANEGGYNIPKIGMMLETKKALATIETFIEPDFLSIGTNDLTHELYNISRDDETNEIFNHIQELLESLKKVVEFCKKRDICLSICGELASIKDVAKEFYKIGIKNLSVSPASMVMLNMAYDEYINNK